MKVQLVDLEDCGNPLNGTWVESRELREVLEPLSTRPPFVLEIRGENGYMLQVGIAELVGCVQHSPCDGDVPYLMALARGGGLEDDFEFLMGGTPSPISGKYLLPINEVWDIAASFAETGVLDSVHDWEEI